MTCLVGGGAGEGCSLDGLLKSNELPPTVTDPAITQTPAGARMAYNGTLLELHAVNKSFIAFTGRLSDELFTPAYASPVPDPVDLRLLDEGLDFATGIFTDLNEMRQRARQAVGLLSDYLPEEPALRAHLYAVQGYAEVMLAELFCSGIPLSTVDYKGDYTLRPGSSTAEVFSHATALFDTALALAGDSARILNLSRVGRARALLGLGDYAMAAAAVAAVPDTFHYTLRYIGGDQDPGFGYYRPGTAGDFGIWNSTSVSDHEGANGLDYRSSSDPRTLDSLLSNGYYHPNKYRVDGADTIVLASGVEARLIAAEAALQAGDAGWLDTLNHLRETAITPALADTSDPDSDTARVSLLFRERAFWLFLTGHRQGDMRRLVRQYHRPQEQVYPSGYGPSGVPYGAYVDVPIPLQEQTVNPLFTGCQTRD